jgi:catechol 2,3-dioxygenase
MGMREVHREDGTIWVHAWDDYQTHTLQLIERAEPGLGRLLMRTVTEEVFEGLKDTLAQRGIGFSLSHDYLGLGEVIELDDPDGHPLGIYWHTQRFATDAESKPALKNQAAAFPGRGANVRRFDHANFLAKDVQASGDFLEELLGAKCTERIIRDDGPPLAEWFAFGQKSYDVVYTEDWTGSHGRLHHIAFATDTREDILKAADVFLEAGTFIETGPHKHAIQQTFFLYVLEPGGNRIELCNAGARLILDPDWQTVEWTTAERSKGQAWGLKTVESFHTYGTPIVDYVAPTTK